MTAVLDPNGLPPGYPFRRDDETTPRELRAMPSGKVRLLDVRTQSESDICRLEGAMLLPLQTLDARMDDLKAAVDDDLDAPIVVYCHHGRRSLTATFMLRAAGFRSVTSLAGGIDLWARDIDRTMATY